MSKWAVAVVMAAFAAGVSAQEAEKKAYPFEGEVSVERLNVRMFPKADQTSIITSVLALGDKVTVVGEKDEYFQVLPPRGSTVWIFARSVKREGEVGTIVANDVPVRLDSRVNADILCTLKENDTVKILGEHMGWFKIEAPAAVKYFVGRKYVRAGKELDPALAAAVLPAKKGAAPAVEGGDDAKARATIAVAEAYLDEQTKLVAEKKLDQVDFGPAIDAFDAARQQAKSDVVKAEAERGLKRYREIHLAWETTKAQIKAKEEEFELARANAKKAEEVAKGPVFQGYIDTTGVLFKRPGTHKLVMGGKILCFLRIREGDEKMITRLNDHYQKFVGVNGTVIKNPEGWEGYSVVVVDELIPLQNQ